MTSADKRPTSPHLSIYKPQITSVMSITHRATGVALYAGTAILVWWLWTLAYDPAGYAAFVACVSSTLGQIALAGWTFAFCYHLANGVRHLFWDMGKGFAISQVESSGFAVILFAVMMTAVVWNSILNLG
ncbi:MAG: succinate dehydrogenase, cytochrome b556 subunit [Rickettsiales bacterium]|jgi:succinate dehydrogenase / fumarate reductase cytochrome b subunit|nr:succinate dehydrogenase, cytochrome b556 subunit [Rickettsiales bacterium]